jgi:DNA repair exonuclease SbcCD ATPase subunit
MIPLKITLSGFMSYREQQTLTFDGARLWVLSGPNGAGKSAIFDAITFVLFGVYRDQKQNFTDLINHGSDRAVVVYDFRLGESIYRVQRTVPKRGTPTRCAYRLITPPDGGELKPEPIEKTDHESGFKEWVETKVGLNYETFTASVLLQQGKSDRLLDSATDQRYKILSKLIDLSRYEELEARAKDRKRYWDGRVTFYNGQLANLSPVLDRDLVNAQQRINKAIDASKVAQAHVDELTELFGHAQTWELLHDQLTKEQADLDSSRQLIDQETEIVHNYQRWMELTHILPILRGLFASQTRLDEAQKAESRHKQEYDSTLEPIRLAEEREEKLRQENEEQIKAVNAYQQKVIDASNRQLKLNPTIVLLDRIDTNQLKRKNYLGDLSEFPPDLPKILTDALEHENRSLEAGKAVPWLRNLTDNRKKLRDAVTEREKAIRDLAQAQADREEAIHSQQRADSEYNQARLAESSKKSLFARAQAILDEIQAKATRFSEVEGEKVCRYCGNELTPEHVEQENEIIRGELAEARKNVAIAQDDYAVAAQLILDTEAASKKAKDTVNKCDANIKSLELARNTAMEDISEYIQSLSTAYTNLPLHFQCLVAESLPQDETSWLVTSYPIPDDISQAKKEGDDYRNQHATVERLRNQIAMREKKLTLLAEADEALEYDRSLLPTGWENARSEYEDAQRDKEQADSNYRTAKTEQVRIENEFTGAKREADRLKNQRSDAEAALNRDRAIQSEITTTLNSYEEQLTPEWTPLTGSLTSSILDEYKSELISLAHYDQLQRDLSAAKQTLKSKVKNVADLQKKINKIPETARCKAEEIRAQLTLSQTESQRAETERIQAEQDNQALLKRKSDREVIAIKKRNAERKVHLYGILAEQMGDQGIQQALINQAEVEIVNEANQSLYNLSGGRWTLSLRERGRNKKALDMEVRDIMTGGQNAIPVVLASGSQRFRIAISIALAIGKYIRRESRRVESVIIDEGFGSLDKTGREDTIQELRSLQQHLERIVLVSHQEEFYKTFQTGYTIDIVNGASQASLVNN